jgi:hypothetical protein
MIILEKPYVSDFLQQTVVQLQIPVLSTDYARNLGHAGGMNLVEPEAFFARVMEEERPLLYSNSENSIGLLNRYCPDHAVTKTVNDFKDKSKLREFFAGINPDVWFRKLSLAELDELDTTEVPKPFVIKPVRGFASIGIHAIHHDHQWEAALLGIKKEVQLMEGVFPGEVVSLDAFLIERYIGGTEIAIDAYFSSIGEPVVLNILTHLFGSPTDMSDRLYLTSDEIVRKYFGPVMQFLEEIAIRADLRNFPFHLEMRQEADGNIVPIEINPMRFMGFCVADVEYYFYGINPYEYYFQGKKPDWDHILSTRGDKIYGMFGIDIPKHLDKGRIRFNYEKFTGHFSRILHHVKMDYTRFPMAIYLFAEARKDQFAEFESILYSDLSEFIDQKE